MTYHVARNSQLLGTFSKEDLLARYNRGEILPTDLVWTEGMTTWHPASQIFGTPAPASAASTSFPNTPPPIPATPVATPFSALDLPPIKPDNNLFNAILVTLLCCWPLGIPSIVYAAQVDAKYNEGDYAGTEDAAKKSRTYMSWAIGLAIVFSLFGVIMGLILHR